MDETKYHVSSKKHISPKRAHIPYNTIVYSQQKTCLWFLTAYIILQDTQPTHLTYQHSLPLAKKQTWPRKLRWLSHLRKPRTSSDLLSKAHGRAEAGDRKDEAFVCFFGEGLECVFMYLFFWRFEEWGGQFLVFLMGQDKGCLWVFRCVKWL